MALESNYLKPFMQITWDLWPLRGNRICVEILPRQELKSKGGIILNTSLSDHKSSVEQRRPRLCVVLHKGNGYVDENNEPVDIDVEKGGIVLVSQASLDICSELPFIAEYIPDTAGFITENSIIAYWPSYEAFEQLQKEYNRAQAE